MICTGCGAELELRATTYSNCDTEDIYYCPECEQYYLEDFLTGEIYIWHY